MAGPFGNLLIVDNDERVREEYYNYFTVRFPNLKVKAVAGAEEAVEELKENVDIVLMDMILKEDARDGYEALLEMKNANPAIEVIAFTQSPHPEWAVRCMRAGCLDYVSKTIGVEALARRVPEAIMLSRSGARRRMLEEQLILADWEMLDVAKDNTRKGKYLEKLIALLLSSIPGWSVSERVRSSNEEFDLVVRNEIDDVFWARRGSFILVECKNWSSRRRPQTHDCASFYRKIERRSRDYCRLGIFVSLGGVTKGFEEEASLPSEGERPVILVLDRQAVWELICARDRSEWLKDRIQARVFGDPSLAGVAQAR